MISVQNNMLAWYANRQFQMNKKDTAKGAEKLSSGYRINRAADDAAGLAISEKMRKRIRGLAQGSKNGQDGVSWTQIGDGALNEAHDIIHRMEELTVKSLNGTNSDLDRAAMDSEFEWLKLELDRISTTTQFNEINIFEEHEPAYHQCEGGAKWDSGQMHAVTAGQNEITFEYRAKEDDPPQTVSFAVPPGEYTTMELLDELEDVIPKDNGDGSRFVLDYNEGGFVNVSLENGAAIDSITGGLSYLIYDMYNGGSAGALIGTTIFKTEDTRLPIEVGKNDQMSFVIEYFDPNKDPDTINIKIPTDPGSIEKPYTRQELIDEINKQIGAQLNTAPQDDPIVKATPHGTGIKLGSNEAIVTGFTGNMFRIDEGKIYHSVFYDNVMYGSVKQYEAHYTGGYVLSTDSRDVEHAKIKIEEGVNNVLSFEPNSGGVKYNLEFKTGEYTLEEISKQINDFCKDPNHEIDMKAEVISTNLSRVSDTVDSKAVAFKGLKLTSGLKGPDSTMGIDTSCSAYKTLFVTRNYNEYGTRAGAGNETKADANATLTGGKTLSGMSPTQAITLTASNNEIHISITDNKGAAPYSTSQNTTSDTLNLFAKKYTSFDSLITEINGQIGTSKLAGKIIAAKSSDGKILLKGVDGECVNSISVSSGSSSYGTLFKNTTVSYVPQTNRDYGSITLETPGKANSNTIYITVNDGPAKPVTLTQPANKDKIAQDINTALAATAKTDKNTFTKATGQGSSTPRTVSGSGKGSESVTKWVGDKTGDSKSNQQGEPGFEYSSPAVVTVDPPLKNSMVIDSTNNQIELTINKTTKPLTLTEGTYDPQSLAAELQKQIDDKDHGFGRGEGYGGASVAVKDGKLVITANLPEGYDGKNTRIACSTDSSSLLKYLNTVKKPAECTSNLTLAPSININGANNQFQFSYSTDGGKNFETKNVSLRTGSYSPESVVTMIQGQINAQHPNLGIKASLTNGKLTLTSGETGNNIAIKYSSDGNNSAEALFGNLTSASPATVVLGKDFKSSGTIDSSKNNFSFKLNGATNPVSVKLNFSSWYSRSDFVSKLNKCLVDQNIQVEAFLSGSKLGFRTKATGSKAKLEVTYDESANSAMEAIWGSTTTVTPGVKATWNGNDLTLTVVNQYGNKMSGVPISVSSETSGGLQPKEKITSTTYPTSSPGYHSTIFSYLDGVDLNGDVEIDEHCDLWKFKFKDGDATKNVEIRFDKDKNEHHSYTYDELKDALQTKLNNQVGQDKIVVTVDEKGVRLQAKNAGSKYQFSDYTSADSDFYWKVMCRCNERSTEQVPDDTHDPGYQNVKKAYIMGRKDVKSEPVEIEEGVNNELSMKLTYGDKKCDIKVELDAGKYGSEELTKHLQDKIDDWMEAHDMRRGVIQVGVGNIKTPGVAGSNDSKALNFSLSEEIQAPGEGEYIIEGVGGNAAFSIFYQTDGKITPAYTMGSKDIRDGVTINENETDLSFVVDGQSYTINLSKAGEFTAKELVDEINDEFQAQNIPLVANVDYDTGRLKISYNQVGDHEISKVSGGAKDEVFFAESGRKEDVVRHIQLSDVADDTLELPRSEFSTAVMGIHSVCITRPKYARKALERLKPALEKLSNLRSNFGSTQNRLEHAINNNNNAAENTQAAESAIRDTDMAKQMVDYSNQKILEQVGQAMMAQANRSNEIILALLS